MGDSNLIEGKRLKVANPQKRRMPDVLHTKNVIIPTVKPVPFKQRCGTFLSENRCQILKAQNYRKNPAFLFSDAPLHRLYDSWENPLEAKQVGRCKGKNQSTKHTVLGKTESRSMKKTSTSQSSYPSKRSSRKKKNNASHFPNAVLAQSEPSTDTKNLHKASSRSIKLSRKGDLQTQIKECQIKHEDIFSFLPKIETSINNVTNKPVVSLPSQSFYEFVDTVSTVSMVSLSSYKISNYKMKNKKTFGDITKKAISSIASNHLHSSNSEYEINVLHYENDILPGNDCPQFTQSHLKSTSTNWSAYDYSSAKNQDNNLTNERNTIENYTWDEGKIMDDIKWKLDNWMTRFRRKELDNEREIKIAEKTENRSPYRCKIKYSWQVIGTGTQTSHTLLQDLLNNIEDKKSAYKMCSIKYSWQIIGISTQASLHDHNDPDYWNGMLLTPSKNYNGNEAKTGNNETDHAKQHDYVRCPEGRLKKYLILNNQETQTFAEKEIQADPNDYMEQILEALTKQKLADKLELEQIDNYDELSHKYVIKPLTPNIYSKNSVISDNGNEKTKKEELLMRLTYALKKLNQHEQNMDKNQSTDVQHSNAENTCIQKGTVLPPNVEDTIKGIIESTQEYIAKLDYQLKDLDNADQQIENSMTRTLKDIDGTFQSLLDDVCHEINKRREQLILEAEIHKHESLIPLKACRREVEAQVQNAQNIISMSENILRHPHRYNVNGFGKIISASNDIGRIPAVPYSEELPNINFDRPLNSYKEEIIEQISKLGCISRTVPVQIINIEERPAGLFVKWHVTNPEYFAEEQTFVVEKANGEILDPASSKFETIYRGSETSCFIRNIPIGQPVTLRVRIQADNVVKSVHHVARTFIPPYSWDLDNKDYMITNNGKMAAKVTNTLSTLFSQGSQFDANHIIEFKFLEVPQEGNDDEGIALVYEPQGSHDTLKRAASLMITPQGKIFMDGEEKLMRLPRVRVGAVIMISAFRKNVHVLRVNIESENKCVTYDWRVQTPLYLAVRFVERKKWLLMIE